MSRLEQQSRSMADAKEFQVSKEIKRTRAFLCLPEPPRPPRCRPCPCLGQGK